MKDQRISEYRAMFAALQMLGAKPDTVAQDDLFQTLAQLRDKPAPRDRDGDAGQLRRLQRENALLIDHAEMLACALGACPNCWGTIPDCEDCGGIGTPGAFNPDRSCFDHFVLPVITRVLGRDEDDDIRISGDALRRAGFPAGKVV
ncbi:hypothetical protein [Paracoccus sp. R86501]|uniref:hypothetical protein n=1 Tax=Paracoccus sp. R86501 TaxID=3101711 RepID=UPI00366E09FF